MNNIIVQETPLIREEVFHKFQEQILNVKLEKKVYEWCQHECMIYLSCDLGRFVMFKIKTNQALYCRNIISGDLYYYSYGFKQWYKEYSRLNHCELDPIELISKPDHWI